MNVQHEMGPCGTKDEVKNATEGKIETKKEETVKEKSPKVKEEKTAEVKPTQHDKKAPSPPKAVEKKESSVFKQEDKTSLKKPKVKSQGQDDSKELNVTV